MSDPPKTSAPYSFGAPAVSGSSGTFGQATAGGIFGSNKPTTTSSSIFGGTSATSGAPSFQFPGSTSNAGSSPSLFGSSTSTSGNVFGGGSRPANTGLQTPNKSSDTLSSGPNVSSSAFGGTNFGNLNSNSTNSGQPGSTTPATSKPGFSFLSTTPAGPPPNGGSNGQSFGLNIKPTQTQNKEQGSSLFAPSNLGQSSAQNTNPTGIGANSFGSFTPGQSSTSNPTSNSATKNIFGTATVGAAKPFFSFSKPSEEPNIASPQGPMQAQNIAGGHSTGSLNLGNSTANNSGRSIFSNANKPQETSGQQSPFAHMEVPVPASDAQNSTSTPATQTSFFPAAPKEISTSGNSNTTAAPTPATVAPSFSIFSKQPAATSTSTTPAPTAATVAPSFSLFNKQSAATTTSATTDSKITPAAPSFNLFNKQLTSASTPNTSASTSAAPASFNMFNDTSKQPTATTTPQPPTVNVTTSGSDDTSKNATNLGGSTVGPRPPAQSRLKNKSMDEIITRWASDLSKYQKEFQKQAQQVADWDRMLVENSEKIQKLYASTLEAERANVEVERQLSAVEGDQAELEYWLEHYERQVDEMLSSQVGQGDTLSGPDQERERTYKLAEKLSDRLDEMAKDLTSMIEEINDASSNLSKNSKADDPLSQIVRVLNGHLSQLQQIDQGTAALQAKVSATQKASRSLGPASGLIGLTRNDAADDFYRSYMGRR